jgi:hypothetical protein
MFTGDVIEENVLVKYGVKKMNFENPNKIQVSGVGGRKEPLLHCLVRRLMVDDILHLLHERDGVDVNVAKGENRRTPLYHAVNIVTKKNMVIVEAMLVKGATFGGSGRPKKLTGQMAREISKLLSTWNL